VDFHPEIPLVTLLSLVHLQIPLPLFVLRGAGHRDEDAINDYILPHHHTSCAEMSFDDAENLLTQPVLL
jgi:hypothetical protein